MSSSVSSSTYTPPIQIGGLSSGLDTGSIISQLMSIAQQPLTNLQNEETTANSRLAAYTTFNSDLTALNTAIQGLDTAEGVNSYSATLTSSQYLSATADSTASAGSYQVDVQQLAQVQKSVSQSSYSSDTATDFTSGTLTVNGTDITISNDSLTSLAQKINDANTGSSATGVSASIINDGSGYRMVLTGADASTSFTATASGMTTANGAAALDFGTPVQSAKLAKVQLDGGINITSTTNTIANAIPGVTLNLSQANATGVTTTLTVGVNASSVQSKMQGFVTAYNRIVNFISSQSGQSWANDSAFTSVERKLQDILTGMTSNSGDLVALSQVGVSTNKDGTISLDTTKFTDVVQNDMSGLQKLLVGDTAGTGLASQFENYLSGITDSSNGILAGVTTSTNDQINMLDQEIASKQLQLDTYQKNLQAQYNALETLMTSMNSKSSFITSQVAQWSQKSS